MEKQGASYRKVAGGAGMSLNRIGIILRDEGPVIDIDELGQICNFLELNPFEVLKQAEESLALEVEVTVNNVVPFPKRPREPLKPELTALPEMA